MSDALRLLKSIQLLRMVINPFFFITFHVRRKGFIISSTGVVTGSCFLLIMLFYKIYFILQYPVDDVEDYVDNYGSFIPVLLCFVSHFGYVINSKIIVKSLNEIISQTSLITEEDIFSSIFKIVTLQVFLAFAPLLFASVAFAFQYQLFDGHRSYWGYIGVIIVDCFIKMHFAGTSIIFGDGILFCHRIIFKTNEELEQQNEPECQKLWSPVKTILVKQDKGNMIRPKSPSEELICKILIYDKVCQWCMEFNDHLGNPITTCCVCNLVQMLLYSYFLTKYGFMEVWMCVIILLHCFLQEWFILYACEKFRKEIQNTGAIVNRLIMTAYNQKQKELLQQFSILLLHRKIKFTACGLFSLDYKMIFSAVATIATYLVVAFQFEFASQPIPIFTNKTTTIL